MKRKLNTPILRLAEARRLAIALRVIGWEISDLIHDTDDGWHEDEEINRRIGEASRQFESFVGRLVAHEGWGTDDWMDRVSRLGQAAASDRPRTRRRRMAALARPGGNGKAVKL